MHALSRFRLPGTRTAQALVMVGVGATILGSPVAHAKPVGAHAAAATLKASFEGESMTISSRLGQVVGKKTAVGGRALLIWSAGGATRKSQLAAGTMTVRAAAELCSGAPKMTVEVDGKRALSVAVTSTAFKYYEAPTATVAGFHTVKVSFDNDYRTRSCDRNLFVDRVGVTVRTAGESPVDVPGDDGGAVPGPVTTPTPSPQPPAPVPTPPMQPPTPPTPPTPTPTPPAPPTTGEVLWNGDVANGNLSQYSAIQTCNRDRAQVVGDPMGVNRNAIRMTVFNSDTAPCTPTENPRGQILSPSILREGGEYWIGWSLLIPNDFPVTRGPGDNWISLGSVYGPPFNGSGSNGLKMDTSPGQNKFYYRRDAEFGYDQPWQMPIVRGKWVDFVFHLKMSKDSSVGFREQYVNTGAGWTQQLLMGQKRLMMRTMTGANGGGANYSKQSLYFKRGIMSAATVYFASHRIGTSFSSVAPHSYD